MRRCGTSSTAICRTILLPARRISILKSASVQRSTCFDRQLLHTGQCAHRVWPRARISPHKRRSLQQSSAVCLDEHIIVDGLVEDWSLTISQLGKLPPIDRFRTGITSERALKCRQDLWVGLWVGAAPHTAPLAKPYQPMHPACRPAQRSRPLLFPASVYGPPGSCARDADAARGQRPRRESHHPPRSRSSHTAPQPTP